MMTNIESIQVVFNLPEWTSAEQFDEEIILRYPGGHAWAGQVQGYRNDNVISRGLFDIKSPGTDAHVKETCLDPMGQSVTVEFYCGLGELPIQIKFFQKQFRLFLEQIRRSKND